MIHSYYLSAAFFVLLACFLSLYPISDHALAYVLSNFIRPFNPIIPGPDSFVLRYATFTCMAYFCSGCWTISCSPSLVLPIQPSSFSRSLNACTDKRPTPVFSMPSEIRSFIKPFSTACIVKHYSSITSTVIWLSLASRIQSSDMYLCAFEECECGDDVIYYRSGLLPFIPYLFGLLKVL